MLLVPWKHSLVRKQFCQVSFFSDHAISFLLFQSILSMLSQSIDSVCFEKKEAKNRGTIFCWHVFTHVSMTGAFIQIVNKVKNPGKFK